MNPTTPKISVAICTHDPRADYFTRTLEGLRAQTLPLSEWEFLIVDNAGTAPLPATPEWHPHGRVVREENVGLTHARLRSIRESAAPLILFVDDDNVLFPDYLERAMEIDRAWPQLGTWGGQTIAEFEEQPAEWTRSFWLWLAIREFDRDRWSNVPDEAAALPYGAGMCVRRHVAEEYCRVIESNPTRKILDRTGKALLGGGDADLSFTAYDLGLGNGIFTALKLTHLIGSRRVQEDYLLKLVESMTYSQTILFSFRGTVPFRPSRSQRLLEWYQSLHVPERDRRFDDAIRRGREAALDDIDRLRRAEPLHGLRSDAA